MVYIKVIYFQHSNGGWDAIVKNDDPFCTQDLTNVRVKDAENYETARVFIKMLLKEYTNNNYLIHTETTHCYVGE